MKLRSIGDGLQRACWPGIVSTVAAGLLMMLALAGGYVRQTAAAQPETLLQVAKVDEVSVTLKPGQGMEVKLTMKKGAKVTYAWKVEGGVVNHDMHGERVGSSTAHSYKKANGVAGDEGVLEAAFDGIHGWFWRNRGERDVTVRLRVDGDYADVKRMM